jgi:putative nucleotidyltransferase with HDIG domain
MEQRLAKRNVLLVDDDQNLVRVFRLSAGEFAQDWDLYFATSAQEALVILSQYRMDVIITDIVMPGMDGNELLEVVSIRYPDMVRFALSGSADNSNRLQATRLAHQFIAKPCELAQVYMIVEQSLRLRDVLSDPQLLKIVTGIKRLPSLPDLYVRLIEELQSEEPTPRAVGDIIAKDVTMTAKILQLVNSAFFGLPGKVTSPQRAVTILGINTIKALVLSIQVFSEYQGSLNPYFSIDELWRHSILTGNIARDLTQNLGGNTYVQGDAQVAGVLHDLGKLIQLRIPGFHQKIRVSNGEILLESEYRAYGVSHAELGAYLLAIWGLPQSIVEAVAYHHTPTRQVSRTLSVTTVIHLANGLYHCMVDGKKSNPENYLDMTYLQEVGLVSRIPEWLELANRSVQN